MRSYAESIRERPAGLGLGFHAELVRGFSTRCYVYWYAIFVTLDCSTLLEELRKRAATSQPCCRTVLRDQHSTDRIKANRETLTDYYPFEKRKRDGKSWRTKSRKDSQYPALGRQPQYHGPQSRVILRPRTSPSRERRPRKSTSSMRPSQPHFSIVRESISSGFHGLDSFQRTRSALVGA
jgi:hypothetical protein